VSVVGVSAPLGTLTAFAVSSLEKEQYLGTSLHGMHQPKKTLHRNVLEREKERTTHSPSRG